MSPDPPPRSEPRPAPSGTCTPIDGGRRPVLELLARNAGPAELAPVLVTLVDRQLAPGRSALWLDDHGLLHPVVDSSPHPSPPGGEAEADPRFAGWLRDIAAASGDPAATGPAGATWSEPISGGPGEPAGRLLVLMPEPRPPDLRERTVLAEAALLASVAVGKQRLVERLHHQAHHDALTGLPNRPCFDHHLAEILEVAAGDGSPLALFFVDLDRFKQINDSLGHAAGDEVLVQVSRRLERWCPAGTTLARRGGDEFCLLVTDLDAAAEAGACRDGPRVDARGRATRLGRSLSEVLARPVEIAGREFPLGASVGVSLHPDHGRDAATLLKHADIALYRAKAEGRGTCRCFTTAMGVRVGERLELEGQLRQALERGELELRYQPQLEVDSGRVVGVEALVRWNHPERGLLAPGTFIGLAEETGLVVPLGYQVLAEACRWAAHNARPDLRLSVNVSARQFDKDDFTDQVAEVLRRTTLAPQRLLLELTESALMADIAVTAGRLRRLRRLGVRVSIDDFGRGYSSLAYLQHLPLDSLKIDPGFLDPPSSARNGSLPLVEAIVQLAHGLGLGVVGEGVEHEEQLAFLQSIDCDEIQGHLLSRPVAAREVAGAISNIEESRMTRSRALRQ